MPVGNGNVTPGGEDQIPSSGVEPRLPDLHDPYLTEEELPIRATFRTEIPDNIPDDFDDLPPEEQERIKNRLRFRGFRLRNDLRDLDVPVSRETLEP